MILTLYAMRFPLFHVVILFNPFLTEYLYYSWKMKYQIAKKFIVVIFVGRFLTQTNFCRILILAI